MGVVEGSIESSHFVHFSNGKAGLIEGLLKVSLSYLLYDCTHLVYVYNRVLVLQDGLVCPANKIHIQIHNNIQIRRYSSGKCSALVGRTIFSDENQFTLI